MAKIIILASYAPSLINFRGPLLAAISKQGHEIIACCPNIDPETKSSLTELGVTTYSVSLNRTGINPIQDLFSFLSLKKIFRRLKPDIVFSYTIKPVIYGSLAAFAAGVPDIYAMITGLGYSFSRNTFKQKIIGNFTRYLYKTALKKNKRVFFQNPDDKENFVQQRLIKESKCRIVNGSGVDLDYYQTQPLPSKTSFLLITRLIKEKGVYQYVEAARIVRELHPSISFSLVGWIDSSPDSINPQDLKSWQQEGIIHFKGRMSDVRPAITQTSVYVLPSYYREGTPRTVLEAMSMGRAIITTDTPGCRETVEENRNGYLIPPRDAQALAKAMKQFVIQPDLAHKMGLESRKIATERFDVHKVNKVILETMGILVSP